MRCGRNAATDVLGAERLHKATEHQPQKIGGKGDGRARQGDRARYGLHNDAGGVNGLAGQHDEGATTRRSPTISLEQPLQSAEQINGCGKPGLGRLKIAPRQFECRNLRGQHGGGGGLGKVMQHSPQHGGGARGRTALSHQL